MQGPCPGWEVDHITALCDGGLDDAVNMQWLVRSDHLAKTRFDRAICNAKKKRLILQRRGE